MGVLKGGIFGNISGKVGNVVAVNRKGVNYLRSKPSSYKDRNSEGQKKHRTKFSLVLKFLKPFAGILAIGFEKYAKGKTGFNVAMSYHLKYAVSGIFPNYTIDYPNTLLCQGKLQEPYKPYLTKAGLNIIAFNWEYLYGNAEDTALIIAYYETVGEVIYQLTNVKRCTGKVFLIIPDHLSDLTAHCWLAFKSVTGKDFSNSFYLGTITV
jgi:hypothetical protein